MKRIFFRKIIIWWKILDGIRWDGKGYDHKNNIIYELKNVSAFIKQYDIFDDLKFEGSLLNGKLNGKIKEFIAEKAKLEEENKKVQLKLEEEKERVRKENKLAEKKRKEEDTEKERQKISSWRANWLDSLVL